MSCRFKKIDIKMTDCSLSPNSDNSSLGEDMFHDEARATNLLTGKFFFLSQNLPDYSFSDY